MPIPAADLEIKSSKDQDIKTVAVIRCNGLTIELSNDISEVLLSRLLKEIHHA